MKTIDELIKERDVLKHELPKAMEEARRRREAQDEWDGTAEIRRRREQEEKERLESLTPEEKIEDEIITLKERIDQERGIYTKRLRPKEKQIIVKW